MRSSNPVFSRRGFSRDNGYAGFNAAPQAGGPAVGTQGKLGRSFRLREINCGGMNLRPILIG